MLSRLFLDHPRAIGETYWAHQRVALGFAGALLGAALACLLHAFVPALCRTTASRMIERLHRRMVSERTRSSTGRA
jgi:hypothetical protein